MAQRTREAELRSAIAAVLRGMLARLQPEEYEAIPAGARYGFRHAAQGGELPALVLEPLHQHLHFNFSSTELPFEDRAGERQPLVARGGKRGSDSHSPRLGRGQTQVTIVRNGQGAI